MIEDLLEIRRENTLSRLAADRLEKLIVADRLLPGQRINEMVLARELSIQPRVLIAAQPTRGLDVSAIEYVHTRLVEQRDQGVAILLISTELDEIFALSDRIAVIYEGEIVAVVPGNAAYRDDECRPDHDAPLVIVRS